MSGVAHVDVISRKKRVRILSSPSAGRPPFWHRDLVAAVLRGNVDLRWDVNCSPRAYTLLSYRTDHRNLSPMVVTYARRAVRIQPSAPPLVS